MAQREPDEGLPVGIKPAPGKMRRQPEAVRIAERVARFVDSPVRKREGIIGRGEVVTPLNPGFFVLERMRAGGVTKKRAKTRKKVSGK